MSAVRPAERGAGGRRRDAERGSLQPRWAAMMRSGDEAVAPPCTLRTSGTGESGNIARENSSAPPGAASVATQSPAPACGADNPPATAAEELEEEDLSDTVTGIDLTVELREVLGVECDDSEEGVTGGDDPDAGGGGADDGSGGGDGVGEDGDEADVNDDADGDDEDVLEPEDVNADEPPTVDGASSPDTSRTPRRSTRPLGAMQTYLNAIRHKLGNSSTYLTSLKSNVIHPPNPLLKANAASPEAFYLPKVIIFAPHSSKGNGYKKLCPVCNGSKVHGDGWSRFRRVIDVNDCFFIIAQRYRCQAKHPNNTFVAWDERLFKMAPPHIRALLPVILTRKLGVTQTLFDMMRTLLDSGMGTGPFADMVRENHTRTFHRREQAYLSRLAGIKLEVGDGQTTLMSGGGAPPRFSHFSTQDGYNGCYGSARYFRSLYVKEMAKLEPSLKQHSAAIPARLLSGDHFFKIIKCNFTFNGKRLFLAAYSLVNEHTEVMANVLTQSKSLEELRELLEGVQKRLMSLGLPPAQVEVFYTDNPTAEASFLETVYPGLKKTTIPLRALGGRTCSDVLAVRPMLDYPVGHYTQYITSRDAAALAVDIFRQDLLADAKQRNIPAVIGLDAEWCIQPGASRKVQVLQLSSRSQTLVLHLGLMGAVPHQLTALLRDSNIGKAGKMIAGDAAKLEAEWALPVKGWFELGMYAKRRKLIPNAGISLAALTEVLLDKALDKSEDLRFGDWSAPLRPEAIKYAGLDAYASYAVYEAARTMDAATPDPGATPAGLCVYLNNPSGTRRVARCTVVGANAAQATADAVQLELEEVYLPGYVVPKIMDQPSLSLRDVAAEGASKGVKPVFLGSRLHLRSSIHPVERRRDADRSARRRVLAALGEGDGQYDALQSLTAAAGSIIDAGVVDGRGADGQPAAADGDVHPDGGDGEEVADPAEEDFLNAELPGEPSPGYLPRGLLSGVRGDVMHAMDRILRRVSKNHGALPLFSRCLAHAIMIYNKSDADAARRVAAEVFPHMPWDEVMYRHPDWVARRVRRVVPAPTQLVPRIQSVLRQFRSMLDASTRQPLFNAAAWRAARQVVKMAQDGWLTDPSDVALYVLRGRDRNNLPLWLCCRGTNSNEGSVHQKLVRNFMSMQTASAELVHFALLEWVHRHNLKAAHNNRADFHSFGHYDVWVLEDILRLQEEVYGERVSFLTHKCATELRLPDFQCGVLPIPRAAALTYGLPEGELLETLRPILSTLSAQKQWLAKRMGVVVPVLPVHTLAEKVLFFKVQRKLRQQLKGPPSSLETTREYNKCVSDYWLGLVGGVERSGRANAVQALKPDRYFKTAAHIAAYEAFYDRSENARSTLHLFRPNEKLRAIASSNTAYSSFGADASSTATLRRPLPSHGAAAARQAAPSLRESASDERPPATTPRRAPAPSPSSPPAPSSSASQPRQPVPVPAPAVRLPSLQPSPVILGGQAAVPLVGGAQPGGLPPHFQRWVAVPLPRRPPIAPDIAAGAPMPLPLPIGGGAGTAAEPRVRRRCGVCHQLGCRGSSNRRRCPRWADPDA